MTHLARVVGAAMISAVVVLLAGCASTSHVSSTPTFPAPAATTPATSAPDSATTPGTAPTALATSTPALPAPPAPPATSSTPAAGSTPASGGSTASVGASAPSPVAALAAAQQQLTRLDNGLSQVDADTATADQEIANGG